jgi:hypothetical protein
MALCLLRRHVGMTRTIGILIECYEPIDLGDYFPLLRQPALCGVVQWHTFAPIMERGAAFDEPDHIACPGALETHMRHPLFDDVGIYGSLHIISCLLIASGAVQPARRII